MTKQQEAEAIQKDVIEAIDEVGSPIRIRSIKQDVKPTDPNYDFRNSANNKGGPIDSEPFNAIVKTEASEAITKQGIAVIGSYNLVLKFYTSLKFNKVENTIIYENKVYKITFISKKVAYDDVLLYEVLVAN